MRRAITMLLLTALLAAMLAGCAQGGAKAPADDTYHPETDHPYSMQTALSVMFPWFAETKEGYYFRAGDILLYMDRGTMEPIPVCGKPDCLHNREKRREDFEACNAYFPGGEFLDLYEDSLILPARVTAKRADGWLTKVGVVMRVSPDGSRRETLWTLGEEGGLLSILCHRGFVYMATEVRDERNTAHCAVTAYSMENPGRDPEVLYEAENAYSRNGMRSFTAYGDRLYFIRTSPENGELELCILDIPKKELTVIASPDPGYEMLFVTFCGSKLLVECTPLADGVRRLYGGNLDGGGMELLEEAHGVCSSDGKHIYRAPSFTSAGEIDPYLRIFDAGMTELDRIDLRELAALERIGLASCVSDSGDRAFLLFWLMEETGFVSRYYWFSKSEIGSGQIELHRFFDDDGREYSVVGR